MKSGFSVILLLVALLVLSCLKTSADDGSGGPAPPQKVDEAFGKMPLAFVENVGQVDKKVKYLIRGPRGTVFFTSKEVVFEIVERIPAPSSPAGEEASPATKGVVVRMRFMKARSRVKIEGQDELPGKINILKGKDPSAWKTGIKRYRGIVYRRLYRGLDLIYTGEGSALSWKIEAGSLKRLRKIKLRYEGIDSLGLDENGNLLIKTEMGTICERAPEVILRRRGDEPEAFSSKFVILDNKSVGIEVEDASRQPVRNAR